MDTGLCVLPGGRGETTTQGLDMLAERCQKYYQQGARFAKWRAVIKCGPNTLNDRQGSTSASILRWIEIVK